MKTLIVNIPDKDEALITEILKKFRFKMQVLSDDDLEDKAIAKWINEGLKTKDIPEEEVFEIFRKNGIKV